MADIIMLKILMNPQKFIKIIRIGARFKHAEFINFQYCICAFYRTLAGIKSGVAGTNKMAQKTQICPRM